MSQVITIKMGEEEYNSLPIELRDLLLVHTREPKEKRSYPEDEAWIKLKEQSTKAYKALKKREFELQHS